MIHPDSETESEPGGSLNLRGLGSDVRPGFSEIRAKAHVKAPGVAEEELRSLCTYVQETSPVKDVLANPVPVHTSIEIVT